MIKWTTLSGSLKMTLLEREVYSSEPYILLPLLNGAQWKEIYITIPTSLLQL